MGESAELAATTTAVVGKALRVLAEKAEFMALTGAYSPSFYAFTPNQSSLSKTSRATFCPAFSANDDVEAKSDPHS